MPDTDPLRVRTEFDWSTINTGMQNSASTIKTGVAQINDSFSTMAAAQIRVSQSSTNLRNTLKDIVASGLQPTTVATEQVAAAIYETKIATDQFRQAQLEAFGATEKVTASVNNSRSAFMGLRSELGLAGNRALATFISQSQSLAPILSAAFTGVAILGFIQLAVQAGEKLSELISKTLIFTEAQQQMYNVQVKANADILKANEEHSKMLGEISLQGKTQTQQEQIKVGWAMQSLTAKKDEVKAAEEAFQAAEKELNTLRQKQALQQAQPAQRVGRTPGFAVGADMSAEIDTAEQKVQALAAAFGVARAESQVAADAMVIATNRLAEAETKAANKRAEEIARTIKELEAINLRRRTLADEAAKLADDEAEFGAREEAKQTEEALRGLELRSEAERQFRQDRIADEERIAESAIEIQMKAVQAEARRGEMDAATARDQLNKLVNEKLAIELDYINRRQAEINGRILQDDAKTYAEDLRMLSQLLTQKSAAQSKANQQIAQNNEAAANQTEKIWDKAFKSINQSFMNITRSIFTGNQTIGQSFLRLGMQIEADIASMLVKAALEWTEHFLLINVLEKTAFGQRLASMISFIAAKHAIESTSNVAQVTGDAGIGAAAAFASVIQALPFPANVATAPGVAAGVFAAIESFAPVASAAGGMESVPRDMLAVIHKDESVIPAGFASGLRNLVNSGRGGGGTTFNVKNSFSGAPSKSDMKQAENAMVAMIKRAHRRGRLF